MDLSIFTRTEKKMVTLLLEDRDHPKEEFVECLYDELSNPASVRKHLSRIRTKLRPLGYDILCRVMIPSPRICYRMVRLTGSTD